MESTITQKHFKVYWNLLKVKYADYKSYIEYFESTYINSIYNKWHYYDVKPNIFLTNNACESLNAELNKGLDQQGKEALAHFLQYSSRENDS